MKILRIIGFILIIFIFYSCKNTDGQELIKLEGIAFGTSFQINYYNLEKRDFTRQIDSLFHLINQSLSTYIPTSDISKINSGDTTITVDSYFTEVFAKSNRVYQETDGFFDPTIGILVNAWGFGPEKPSMTPDSSQVEDLLRYVGFNKVQLINKKVKKDHAQIYFDFNAIAKGYAVDVAARFLEKQTIDNYLVEIGGEVRAKGINLSKNAPWKVGIEDPNFDGSRSIHKTIELHDQAMATSGSYRKFRIDSISGKKYIHIINAKTGFPKESNLLSVSIIGKLDCADVDAYATALIAMPLEEAQLFLEQHSELKGFLIYSNEEGDLGTFSTSNF